MIQDRTHLPPKADTNSGSHLSFVPRWFYTSHYKWCINPSFESIALLFLFSTLLPITFDNFSVICKLYVSLESTNLSFASEFKCQKSHGFHFAPLICHLCKWILHWKWIWFRSTEMLSLSSSLAFKLKSNLSHDLSFDLGAQVRSGSCMI